MSGFPAQQQAQARNATHSSTRLPNGKIGTILLGGRPGWRRIQVNSQRSRNRRWCELELRATHEWSTRPPEQSTAKYQNNGKLCAEYRGISTGNSSRSLVSSALFQSIWYTLYDFHGVLLNFFLFWQRFPIIIGCSSAIPVPEYRSSSMGTNKSAYNATNTCSKAAAAPCNAGYFPDVTDADISFSTITTDAR